MAGLVFFDTNILIDWSKGYAKALVELAHWDHPAINVRRQDVRVPYELKTVSTVTVINVIPPGDTPLPPRAGAATLKRTK